MTEKAWRWIGIAVILLLFGGLLVVGIINATRDGGLQPAPPLPPEVTTSGVPAP